MNILWIFSRLLLGFFCTCKFCNELMSLTKDNRIILPMIGNLDTQVKLQRMMGVQHESSLCVGTRIKLGVIIYVLLSIWINYSSSKQGLYGRKDFCSQPHVVQFNALIVGKYMFQQAQCWACVWKNQKKEPWDVLRRNLTCIYC